jgi:hypothetical protein
MVRESDEDLIRRMIRRYDRLIRHPEKKIKFWKGYIRAEPCLICNKYSFELASGHMGYNCDQCPLNDCTRHESYLKLKYVLRDCIKKKFSRIELRRAAKNRRRWLKKMLSEILDG